MTSAAGAEDSVGDGGVGDGSGEGEQGAAERLAIRQTQNKAVALVCAAHFFSHFYIMLLPPLFPVLRDALGVGYTELGFALSAFSLTTGVFQVPVGYLVDRFGARALLIAALLVESVAFVLIGVFASYSALLVFMVAAGLANAVYHPADYAILNASVANERMGRAFSYHTSSGLLGAAVAPVSMVALMQFMPWTHALILCAVGSVVVALALAFNSSALRDSRNAAKRAVDPVSGPHRSGLRLLMSTPVLMGVLFFIGIAMANHGLTSFGVAVLAQMYALPMEGVAWVLTAYLFAGPVGVLAGGWLADRWQRHDWVAAGCFALVGTCVYLVAGLSLPLVLTALLFVTAGFFNGVVSPSRDMMIRSVTPASEIGKVFGFVSTGFNIGGIVAPPLYGLVLDLGSPQAVFWLAGTISMVTIGTVLITGHEGRRARIAAQKGQQSSI